MHACTMLDAEAHWPAEDVSRDKNWTSAAGSPPRRSKAAVTTVEATTNATKEERNP